MQFWTDYVYSLCHGSPHAPFGGVQKGGPSYFCMSLINYSKPHATALDRVKHLRSKGLIIPQPNVTAKKIERIGYHRLRIYFLSRRQHGVAGRPFIMGTTFKDINQLYECDIKLRDACFSAVGQFEVMFRNSISETLSSTHGSHPYFEINAFKDATSRLDAVKTFTDIYKKSKDQRAKHYNDNYSTPILPPIWTMKEFLTFGAMSRIYNNLSGRHKTTISKDFGVATDEIFRNWVSCLVDLRNICAHHDRLFNRSFQKQPSTLRAATIPSTGTVRNKLKAVLQCLDHMADSRGGSLNITAKVGKIIGRYPVMAPSEAGY